MSNELITVIACSVFLAINFTLIWLTKSILFAVETAQIMRKTGAGLLALCVAITTITEIDFQTVGLLICVIFFIGAWLNVKLAVFSTCGKMKIDPIESLIYESL